MSNPVLAAAGSVAFAALITVLAVTACSAAPPRKGKNSEASAMESHAAPATSKSARIGTWGINLADGDRAVKPGDDFYEYSIGSWLKTNQIPADRTSWRTIVVLADEAARQLRQLVEGLPAMAAVGTNEK